VAGDPGLFYRLDADAQADVIGLLLARGQEIKAAQAPTVTAGSFPQALRPFVNARQGGG